MRPVKMLCGLSMRHSGSRESTCIWMPDRILLTLLPEIPGAVFPEEMKLHMRRILSLEQMQSIGMM